MARCSQQKGPFEYTSNYIQFSLFENFLYAICMHLYISLPYNAKKRPFVLKFYNYNWLIRTHPLNPPPPAPPPYRSDKNRTKTLYGCAKRKWFLPPGRPLPNNHIIFPPFSNSARGILYGPEIVPNFYNIFILHFGYFTELFWFPQNVNHEHSLKMSCLLLTFACMASLNSLLGL